MKARNGFVSNSSSASFVILGVACTKDEMEKFAKKLGMPDGEETYDFFDGEVDDIECLHAEEKDAEVILGRVYADVHSDGDSLEYMKIPIKEFSAYAKKLAKKLDVDVNRVYVHMGTRSA